jgi:hypothetical protein
MSRARQSYAASRRAQRKLRPLRDARVGVIGREFQRNSEVRCWLASAHSPLSLFLITAVAARVSCATRALSGGLWTARVALAKGERVSGATFAWGLGVAYV